jgi:hypothetical protein
LPRGLGWRHAAIHQHKSSAQFFLIERGTAGFAASGARGITPVRLSRGGCSFQFGRASAPTIPQAVQAMRGRRWAWRRRPASDRRSAPHGGDKFQRDTKSDRTPRSRMLPSVIGSIGWSKRATSALPRSTNPRHNSVAAQPCVAPCAERRQVFCPDEAGGLAVRRFAGARADHISSAGRGDHQHNGEREQGRQNAASSPSHVNPFDFEADNLRGSLITRASYQGRRVPAGRGDNGRASTS